MLLECQISPFMMIGEYRWVQIGTLCSEEWSFSVHFGYTSGKPAYVLDFSAFIGSKRNKNRGKKVQIKRKTSQNITKIRYILASYRIGHRLKNSDFRPFLGALEGKVRDSGCM